MISAHFVVFRLIFVVFFILAVICAAFLPFWLEFCGELGDLTHILTAMPVESTASTMLNHAPG
jgi:hypothetical protein